MTDDCKLVARLPFRFKGLAENWPEWRDMTEAIFRGLRVWPAIQHPRPDAPYALGPAPPVGGAGGDGGGGAGAPPVPAVPLGPNLQDQWDERSAKIYMYLQLYTDGIAKSVIRQHRATGNGVDAWRALNNRFETLGTLGKTMLYQRDRRNGVATEY